jgi:hypothetical protein
MSRVYSAHVRNGVIVADDVQLAEGAAVTVVDDADLDVRDDELTAEQRDAIERARAELARGEGILPAELMAALRRDRAIRRGR